MRERCWKCGRFVPFFFATMDRWVYDDHGTNLRLMQLPACGRHHGMEYVSGNEPSRGALQDVQVTWGA